ncbi:uncharacterized protein LOC105835285 isoform X1 [Monomorium pharaonis]|uniref:uncharacterized protein LOC105835285 isoform X1 n=1 Tax=Monomorium pharaonis TaxID=307658 RepID=UPI001745ED47|nr:uncharacterized protein LOC105835285 isoform X1 [Monomorium pharaonis]
MSGGMSETTTATVLLKKRERTQNWIPEEKSALFALIKQHVAAIENKKIDAAASATKSLAWQQIYAAFRGRFSADRDITRIREQWRRMKAQARMEMYTYAEKVRSLGPEVAAKSRPSNLSIEVWRLMESVRKNDCETADRSDDSQDSENPANRMSIQAILDKLTLPITETSEARREIKIEVSSDTEDENSYGELSQKSDDLPRHPSKRSRLCNSAENEPVDLVEHKTVVCPDSVSTSRVDDGTASTFPCLFACPTPLRAPSEFSAGRFCFQATERNGAGNELPASNLNWNNDGPSAGDRDADAVQREMWIFKSTQREHEIRLRMLHIELERAELQKQTAINELKTSELKKQLIQDQVNEYYSHAIRLAGERGSGAGKGGGSGGTIRDAGGSFGKMEAAHEDQYFYNLQKEQIKKMREGLHDEISFHEEQIKRHQEAINRHKKRITEMDQKE